MTDFDNSQPRDAFFSKKIRAGKRTYYFDVKATRGNDFYITITESKRKPGESEDRPMYEKHKLFLYKEDFEKFTEGLQDALNFIRTKREDADPMQDDVHELPEMPQVTFEESMKSTFTDLDFDDLTK